MLHGETLIFGAASFTQHDLSSVADEMAEFSQRHSSFRTLPAGDRTIL
jgi:hypothetical protein